MQKLYEFLFKKSIILNVSLKKPKGKKSRDIAP
jgi:hypothetical protein